MLRVLRLLEAVIDMLQEVLMELQRTH